MLRVQLELKVLLEQLVARETEVKKVQLVHVVRLEQKVSQVFQDSKELLELMDTVE